MAEFTEQHVGKRVVDQDGSTVGEVTSIDNGSLVVTVGEDADRDTIDALNWGGRDQRETHVLNDRQISNIREDTVRLRV